MVVLLCEDYGLLLWRLWLEITWM